MRASSATLPALSEKNSKKNLIKAQIKARFKSIYSIWHKMREQEIAFDDIYDFFAIRIIIEAPLSREKETCWKAYSLITESYAPHPERLRDWISMPRSNGYEALHTTVMSPQGRWVEIQIRSTRMDKTAERGYAAHWRYKDDKLAPIENGSNLSLIENWIHDLRDALQNESHHNAIDFVQDFTSHLAGEDVYVFTPKGETRILPKGSTAIDFAFDIHTEVGLNYIGAKVNNKLESMDYVLKHGDMIEVLTSTKRSVGSDWLSHAITAKARASIRQELRQKRKEKYSERKTIFQKSCQNPKNKSLESPKRTISRVFAPTKYGRGLCTACTRANFPTRAQRISTTSARRQHRGKSGRPTTKKTPYFLVLN